MYNVHIEVESLVYIYIYVYVGSRTIFSPVVFCGSFALLFLSWGSVLLYKMVPRLCYFFLNKYYLLLTGISIKFIRLNTSMKKDMSLFDHLTPKKEV